MSKYTKFHFLYCSLIHLPEDLSMGTCVYVLPWETFPNTKFRATHYLILYPSLFPWKEIQWYYQVLSFRIEQKP